MKKAWFRITGVAYAIVILALPISFITFYNNKSYGMVVLNVILFYSFILENFDSIKERFRGPARWTSWAYKKPI
ncbi:MAG: hypothetical protein CMB80_05540 [Flammeovirgaceae bacterium]|nr:hypothetical protein [Flammeovirgaceae bacterium]|tara:strand:+ start:10699 stop:10920 length:222 start_codon:yes stop_codon:yes gene_type:complete